MTCPPPQESPGLQGPGEVRRRTFIEYLLCTRSWALCRLSILLEACEVAVLSPGHRESPRLRGAKCQVPESGRTQGRLSQGHPASSALSSWERGLSSKTICLFLPSGGRGLAGLPATEPPTGCEREFLGPWRPPRSSTGSLVPSTISCV